MPTDRSDDMRPPAHSIEELLQHDAWLRRLIASLVGADRADDVVQQTWMAAMKDPPRGSARAWLAAVARRLAFRRQRDDARRAHREAAVARADEVPSTAATLEKLAAQRAVTEAVHELAEPYRTAVLLRHHHELGYGDVAARMRCSEAAARQRVKRGLDDVRAALHRTLGPDWRAAPGLLLWLGPGAPLGPTGADGPVGRPPTGTVPVATAAASRLFGVFVVTKTLTVSASILAAAVAAFLWWPRDPVAPPSSTTPTTGSPVAAHAAERPRDAAAAPDPTRTEAQDLAAAAPEPFPAEERARLRQWQGRVLDPKGRPLAGVWVTSNRPITDAIAAATPTRSTPVPPPPALAAAPPAAHGDGQRLACTDALGRFALALPAVELALDVDRPYVAIHRHLLDWDLEPGAPIVLVAVPAVDVTGAVFAAAPAAERAGGSATRAEGQPLADVDIALVAHELLDLDVPIDRANRVDFERTRTDGDGRFALPGAPSQAYNLEFRRGGYRTTTRAMPLAADGPLVVWMQPEDDGDVVLVGSLLDSRGGLVVGGTVGFDEANVTTSDAGRYRLTLRRQDLVRSDRSLYAGAPGQAGLLVADPLAQSIEQPDGTHLLDLVLPGEAQAIAGRVLGPDGQPWPDVVVYLWQEETVSVHGAIEEFCQPRDREGHDLVNFRRTWAETDADGAFRLGGLRPHRYRLRAMHRGTLAATVVDAVDAGTEGLEIRFPPTALVPEVRGVVRNPDGAAVAGAKVSVMVTNWASGGSSSAQAATHATSDEQGRFTLGNVPTGAARLVADDPGHVRTEVPIDAAQPFAGAPLDVTVVLPRRCHLKLDVQDSCPDARQFAVHDADDRALDLFAISGRGASWTTRRQLDAGRSEVLQVSEFGVTLVLLDGDGAEIRRVPIRLRPGEVTPIR